MNKNLLIVFSKNPILGKVKTRLAKSIGEKKALLVYKQLIKKTIDVLIDFEDDIAIFHTNKIAHENIWNFTKYQKIQKGKDLGARMKNAFEWGFNIGYNKILIIGTDLWDLEKKILINSYNGLENNDVVFGPALDGGYYLLGLKKMINSIFDHKSWGSENVMKNTLKKIKRKKIYFLRKLNDIDDIEDLRGCEELLKLI